MKKIFQLFIVVICAAFAGGSDCYAATLPVSKQKEVIHQINKATSAIKSMSCSFTQTKYLSLLSDKMVSEGKMNYSQPNRLRWEYTTPYKYLFIFNGAKVYVGNNNRKDVIDTNSNKLFKEVARIMMSTVTGTALSNADDFETTVADGKICWEVTLVPKKKEMRKMFSRIVLSFNKSDYLISEINMYEKNNDRTNIKLHHIKNNIALNETLFAIP